MTSNELAIGIAGCGNVSETYLRNAPLFDGVSVVACADVDTGRARTTASKYGIEAMPVQSLIRHDDVDLVLNLTVPLAHFDVSMAALRAGKHVYSEKPLAASGREGRRILAQARSAGVSIGCAPDTFLGAAGRCARRIVEEGAIGTPVSGTAFMFGRGMEHWHPDPGFYYQPGAGPLFDMGPYYLTMLVHLLGPIRRVLALSSSGQAERLITAEGPLKNTTFDVATPTTVLSLLEFHSNAIVSFGTSWDVFRHSNHPIELHGTDGSLRLPDPDTFGGTVSLSAAGQPWSDFDSRGAVFGQDNWPPEHPDRANYRMLAVAELARSLTEGTQPRTSGELALHVLDVMEAIALAARDGVAVDIEGAVEQPRRLDEDEAASLVRQVPPSSDDAE